MDDLYDVFEANRYRSCWPKLRVSGSEARIGAAARRNIALLDCKHPLVMNLDADDIPQPGALPALAEALAQNPEAAFAFGRTLNLQRDGKLREWDGDLLQKPGSDPEQPVMPYKPGLVPVKAAIDQWGKTGRHHVTLAATMWRKHHLLAHLFPAMGLREDEALLFNVNWDHPGVFVPDPVILHYREHDDQTTRRGGFDDWTYRKLIENMIASRNAVEGNTPES